MNMNNEDIDKALIFCLIGDLSYILRESRYGFCKCACFLLQIIKSIFDILTLVLLNPDICPFENNIQGLSTGPRSAVGNVSGYRCVSDCRSRGREFDPGPVPYFRGD